MAKIRFLFKKALSAIHLGAAELAGKIRAYIQAKSGVLKKTSYGYVLKFEKLTAHILVNSIMTALVFEGGTAYFSLNAPQSA